MVRQRYIRKIQSLEALILEHRDKIKREQKRATPDLGLIRHWEQEIRAFQDGVRRARKRLGGQE
jgi:hypothetical protein